jgi:hypothetical protein
VFRVGWQACCYFASCSCSQSCTGQGRQGARCAGEHHQCFRCMLVYMCRCTSRASAATPFMR